MNVRDHLEVLGLEGRVILKWNFAVEDATWIDLGRT
jgi:hypothetical protein